jgi:hypothetical protein
MPWQVTLNIISVRVTLFTLSTLCLWVLPINAVRATLLAPNSGDRASVTPGKRGKGAKPKAFEEEHEKTSAQRRAAMTWRQRLKREPNRLRTTARISDSTVGHAGE